MSGFQCKEEEMSKKVQLQRVKEVTRTPADVWTFPLKLLYDKVRRTVTGKGKDERELWQVEGTLPEDTAVWVPQRPESEAEPERGGDSTCA